MKSKIIEDADVVTYVVVCDQGDQAVATLQQFAQDEDLEASRMTGVGGFAAGHHLRLVRLRGQEVPA